MRKVHFVETVVSTEIVDQIFCNKCKKELGWCDSIIPIDFHIGFGSKRDGTNIKFDLCEPCLDEFTATFLIPSDIKERDW